MNKRQTARRFLQHYFRLLAQNSGINWDRDNDAEVMDIADMIIDAAKEEMRAELEEQRKEQS